MLIYHNLIHHIFLVEENIDKKYNDGYFIRSKTFSCYPFPKASNDFIPLDPSLLLVRYPILPEGIKGPRDFFAQGHLNYYQLIHNPAKLIPLLTHRSLVIRNFAKFFLK